MTIPSEISLPFNDWSKKRLLQGIKLATTRPKKYGKKGDYFTVGEHTYVFLIDPIKIPLWLVAKYLWKIEGATSKEDFISVWNKIHRRKKYEDAPSRMVYFHLFYKEGFIDSDDITNEKAFILHT